MNNRENAIKEINDFINSDSERVMLIKGTHQYEKHSLVLEMLNQNESLTSGVFRTNSMQNVTTFLEHAGYDVPINKKISSGQAYKSKGKILYFDSLFTRSTWARTPFELDFAIVYPMDSFCEKNSKVKDEFLNDILERRKIQKIFIVTWTDHRYDYDWLSSYVDRSITFDAKEEDPEYHQRMLDLANGKW
ncbi:hypothetical protein [Bacillus wiedmannii]|uniref:hypothetical protein n=1 Tax=Bacillus wiedmannii TaxID=1890302 RepID=UPI000BFCF83E|nr:hypothetical protein [Bacillus wiedmannii]PGZ95781.1 hypothetical protein COE63_27430 [Bacillus wiedmannii]